MVIGVVGIESTHVRLYADALSTLYPSGEIRIAYAWCGDNPYSETELERILDIDDLINKSDAVIIALRNGMHHKNHAIRCLKAGKPVFVDKPFALLPEDAAEMHKEVEKTDTLLIGGSALCFLPQIEELRKEAQQCESAYIRYWSDPFSPYGGWSFYGSHVCDLCIAIFGDNYMFVDASQNGGTIEAHVVYPNFTVTLSTTAKSRLPVVEIGEKTARLSEKGCFFYAMKEFTQSQNKYKYTVKRLTASVRLMDKIFNCINAIE